MIQTPSELGLPAKFTSWRPGQKEAILAIARTPKKCYFLDAPTGVGKSLIGIGIYAYTITTKRVIDALRGDPDSRYRCLYVTRTKQLQEQVLKDFPNAKTIAGRSNYVCAKFPKKFPEVTAEDCPGKCGLLCAYRQAKAAAVAAPVAVLNEAYYLAEINGPGQFSGADYVVLDEVDGAESGLLRHIQFTISERQLKNFHLTPPAQLDNFSQWLAWADKARGDVLSFAQSMKDQLNPISDNWSDLDITMNKQVTRLASFGQKLATFLLDVNESWIFSLETNDKSGWKAVFKPIQVSDYADRYLWRHADLFLGMSGSIFDPKILAADLGAPDYEYSRMDSPFPVKNRPLLYCPLVGLKFSTMQDELPKLAAAVDTILKKYPKDRILVHTVSYRIRDYLLSHLVGRRLMTHNSEDREQALQEFKRRPGAVMISPSFDRGVDLPNEFCRCVIICKVPYLGLGDLQTKARMSKPDGQRWYNLKAIQSVVQMSGRGVRGGDDFCDCIILDRQFGNLLARTRHALPKWWMDAIQTIEKI